MTSVRVLRRLVLVAAALVALGTGYFCHPDGGIAYRLTEGSAWLEGCIVGPCLCPVRYDDSLRGSFVLEELPTLQPGPTRLFAVRDLLWMRRDGDRTITIRGRGLYSTAAPVLDQQRLILDLEVDGDPLATLDSGLVEGGLAFPSIAIEAITPGECFQTAIQLRAEPFEWPLEPPEEN
ncbi:MAG: hypothetical protein QNK03_01940 [Myxococcota bacterium]|nr:hypothetical protein [Myxococcota bacterium]